MICETRLSETFSLQPTWQHFDSEAEKVTPLRWQWPTYCGRLPRQFPLTYLQASLLKAHARWRDTTVDLNGAFRVHTGDRTEGLLRDAITRLWNPHVHNFQEELFNRKKQHHCFSSFLMSLKSLKSLKCPHLRQLSTWCCVLNRQKIANRAEHRHRLMIIWNHQPRYQVLLSKNICKTLKTQWLAIGKWRFIQDRVQKNGHPSWSSVDLLPRIAEFFYLSNGLRMVCSWVYGCLW